MLGFAIDHEYNLAELYRTTWLNDKYKFFNSNSAAYKLEIADSTYYQHQFVSFENQTKDIIGLIGYYIDREINAVSGIYVMNFGGNDFLFAKDLNTALKDIFEKYNFNKINFTVIIGNPVEKHYDRFIKKYGGRIIGIRKDDVKLYDGQYYDRKVYEITRGEYMNTKRHQIKEDEQRGSLKHSLKSLPFHPPKNLLDTIKPNEDIFMDPEVLKSACEPSDILLEVQSMIKEKEELQAKADLEKADVLYLDH